MSDAFEENNDELEAAGEPGTAVEHPTAGESEDHSAEDPAATKEPAASTEEPTATAEKPAATAEEPVSVADAMEPVPALLEPSDPVEEPEGEPPDGAEAATPTELATAEAEASSETPVPGASDQLQYTTKKKTSQNAVAEEHVRQVRLVAQMLSELPTDKADESTAEREKLFKRFDANSNGHLSYSEVDSGLLILTNKKCGIAGSGRVKPAIQRAYAAAREIGAVHTGKPPTDYVNRSEFRLLLLYLRRYSELLTMFGNIYCPPPLPPPPPLPSPHLWDALQ